MAQIESIQADQPADVRPEACETGVWLESVDESQVRAWDDAERFIYGIFRDCGFCEPSPRNWVEEIDPYRPGSTLQVAGTRAGIVGAIRTMLGSYHELPIGQFTASEPVPGGLMCEFGSLAVHPDVRGLGVVNELHRRAVQWAVQHRAIGFCMLVEPWSIGFFRDVYGVPLVETGEGRLYMGSLTVPAHVTLAALFENLLDSRPAMYRWATEGLSPADFEAYGIPILLD